MKNCELLCGSSSGLRDLIKIVETGSFQLTSFRFSCFVSQGRNNFKANKFLM
jgi:hypothetical protein